MKKDNKKIEDKNNNSDKKQHGILSMMAIIIGTVVGSGIFIKNSELVQTNGSILLTIISWVIGTLIVLSTLIVFLEVFSISKIYNEQSTFANWAKRLFNVRFGRWVGVFFGLIYIPLIVPALFVFTIFQFFHTIGFDSFDSVHFWVLFLVGFILMNFFIVLNSQFSTPLKIFQNVGTIIQTIPFVFLIITAIFISTSLVGAHGFNLNQDASLDINPDNKNIPSIGLILITLPPILFSFDGFLVSGSLSKETKKENTFSISVILAVLFIIFMYFIFSLLAFGLGSATDEAALSHGKYGTITNLLWYQFPTISYWLDPLISFMITVSILTGASGLSFVASRYISDLSVSNYISDKGNKHLTRNSAGVSTRATLFVGLISNIWFIVYLILSTVTFYVAQDELSVLGFVTNFIVIVAFVFYSLIALGAFINRFTKKTEVHKINSYIFYPSAFISFTFILISALYFGINIFWPPSVISSIYITEIVLTLLILAFYLFLVFYSFHSTKKLSDKELKEKEKAIEEYYK